MSREHSKNLKHAEYNHLGYVYVCIVYTANNNNNKTS